MRDAYLEIEKSGARLVVIGNGKPEQARLFRLEEQLPFELLVDPELRAYEAAGLRRGALKSLSHRSLGHAWRAMRKGFRQSKVEGDPWQLGGVFLVTPAGELLYQQISREAGDHAPLKDVLGALQKLGPAVS